MAASNSDTNKGIEERDTDSTIPDDSEARIHELSQDLYQKTSAYVQSELESTLDEYKLLEEMNKKVAAKYHDMKQVTSNVNVSITDLEKNYSRLEPFLSQIDDLEEKVVKLEEVAYSVDSYIKRLEAKFKAIEKRWLLNNLMYQIVARAFVSANNN